jgi:hypothetical protein
MYGQLMYRESTCAYISREWSVMSEHERLLSVQLQERCIAKNPAFRSLQVDNKTFLLQHARQYFPTPLPFSSPLMWLDDSCYRTQNSCSYLQVSSILQSFSLRHQINCWLGELERHCDKGRRTWRRGHGNWKGPPWLWI